MCCVHFSKKLNSPWIMNFIDRLFEVSLPVYGEEDIKIIKRFMDVVMLEKDIREVLFETIASCDGYISQNELSKALNKSPSTINRYINEFVLAGFFERRNKFAMSNNY